jgi:uncharacterized protein YbjT (DUF2867 family)
MSNQNKLILVFGATGSQGGSVIDHCLKSGKFRLRALVRDKNAESATKLTSLGVEIVEGDMSKPNSIPDSIFDGVHGVFLLTDYWDPSMTGKELEEGKPIVDKIAKSGVKHLIFSSLPNVQEESKGKWNVPHFTQKALLEKYIRERKDKFDSITFVSPAFYYQNFLSFFKLTKDEKGNLFIKMPQTKSITACDISQLGAVVCECFKSPEKYNGAFIPVAGESSSPQDYINTLSEKLGKKIELKSVPHETYAKSSSPGSEEMANMFGWFNESGYFGSRDWTTGQKIVDLKSFRQWLDENIQCFKDQVSV